MIDVFSLLIGLFVGLFGGTALGAMVIMLVFLRSKPDHSCETLRHEVSTDDEQLTLQHI